MKGLVSLEISTDGCSIATICMHLPFQVRRMSTYVNSELHRSHFIGKCVSDSGITETACFSSL